MKLKDDVIEISSFSNIKIPSNEIGIFVKEFANILAYMDKIGTVKVSKIKKDSIIKHHTPLRLDTLSTSSNECSNLIERVYYKVPKVI